MNDVERAAAIKSPQLGDVWQRSGHNWTLHSASHCLIQLRNSRDDVINIRRGYMVYENFLKGWELVKRGNEGAV